MTNLVAVGARNDKNVCCISNPTNRIAKKKFMGSVYHAHSSVRLAKKKVIKWQSACRLPVF